MFDPTKPVRTRDGQEVEILRSDLKCVEPIVSVITKRDGEQSIFRHSEGGHFFEDKSESSLDLINIPEKFWVNVYGPSHPASINSTYRSRAEAEDMAAPSRIACLEFTEGDGL